MRTVNAAPSCSCNVATLTDLLERFRLLVVYGQPDPRDPYGRSFSLQFYWMASSMHQQALQPLGSTSYTTSKRSHSTSSAATRRIIELFSSSSTHSISLVVKHTAE